MEFRTEKAVGLMLAAALAAYGETLAADVRHEHHHDGAVGKMVIGDNSVSFKEVGKRSSHVWEWKYEDIQQITLSSAELRILTYEDQKWKFGLDREYRFDKLPKEFSSQAYSLFRDRLDQRFVAYLAHPETTALWSIGAKLHHLNGGSQGVIRVAEDYIVYDTEKGESHTWRYTDIENISSSGPFDLSIMTLERSSWNHASPTEYHFQLKEALQEDRYNDLWRRLNRSTGLQIITLEKR